MSCTFNLHIGPEWQLVYRNASPDRLGILMEEFCIDFVHGCKILHVGKENVDFDNIVKTTASGLQHRLEVQNCLFLDLLLNNVDLSVDRS